MATQPAKKPYHGSCHCGFIEYIVWLRLPPASLPANTTGETAGDNLRLRKCNCTTCHKTGFFHLRLPDAPDDFALLNPLSPQKDLSDYTCNEGFIHWYFCPKCGIRCFSFWSKDDDGEVHEKRVPIWKTGEKGVGGWNGEESRRYWAPRKNGWVEGSDAGCYLSVNAITLDAKQEGLDLRDWIEQKKVCWLDVLDEKENNTYERPHAGGCY